MSNPIAPDDTKVEFDPPRPSYYPDLYVMSAKHPKNAGSGRSIYYIQDGSLDAMSKVYELENSLEVPKGGEKGAIAAGFFHMEAGDFLFARQTTSPATGEEDVPVAWVTPSNIFPEALKKKTLAIRDQILGPQNLRSRTKPVNGKGGTAFERDTKPTEVRGGRCYAFGMSHERQTWLSAPCKDGKISEGSQKSTDLRRKLLQVSAEMSVLALRQGPSEVIEHLDLNSELLNIPAIGVETNKYFPAAQLNLAPAEPSTSKNGLGLSLGGAGVEHYDEADHPGYFTHMVAVSDIPKSYHPGLFFLLYPGIFIVLSDFASIMFSGLRKHGGTPPIAPSGTPLSKLNSPIRVTLVMYPPIGLLTASQSRVIGAVAEKKIIYTTEEVIHPQPKAVEWSGHATFCKDGAVIMDQQSLMNFLARSMLSLSHNLVSQLDPLLEAKINSDAFLQSFSFKSANNSISSVKSWPLGPSWRPAETGPDDSAIAPISPSIELVSQRDILADATKDWKEYLVRYAGHIPYAVCKGLVQPLPQASQAALLESVIDGIPEPPTIKDPFKVRKTNTGIKSTSGKSSSLKRKRSDVKGKKSKRQIPFITPSTSESSTSSSDSDEEYFTPKRARHQGETSTSKTITRSRSQFRERSKSRKTVGRTHDITLQEKSPDFQKFIQTFDPFVLETRDIQPGHDWDADMITSDIEDNEVAALLVNENADTAEEPPHLRTFTTEKIQQEHKLIQESILHIMSHGRGDWTPKTSAAIFKFQQVVAQNPLSKSSFSMLRAGWDSVQQLQTNEKVASLLLRKHRSCIIFMTFSVWRWIHITIPNAIERIINDTEKVPWLQSLISSVDAGIEQGGIVAFVASEFLDDKNKTSCSIDFSKIHIENRDQEIPTIIQTILKLWIGYNPNKEAPFQAYLTFLLLRDVGPDIFLLDATWSLYQTVNEKTLNGVGVLDFDLESPLPLSHPLCNPDSPQRQTLGLIATAIQDFLDDKIPIPPTDQSAPQTHTIADIAPPATKRYIDGYQDAFAAFLQDSYAVALNIQHHQFTYPRLKEKLEQNPDFFQPFRETATTRVQMRRGPYSQEHARTVPGIFSAIVGRAITYATPFSRSNQSRSVFFSVADFKKARNETGIPDENKKYFCNTNAYGSPNPLKSVDLAPKYWKSLRKYRWPALDTQDPIPFLRMYRYFRPPAVSPVPFPHLGDLSAYLLTADYVYCNIVQPPTESDMAYLISRLNAGAVSGLEDLGFIPRRKQLSKKKFRKASVKHCADGFKKATNLVKDAIPAELHSRLQVDLILVEHALCKFQRAVTKNLVTINT